MKESKFIITEQGNKPGCFVNKIPSNNKVQSIKQVIMNGVVHDDSRVRDWVELDTKQTSNTTDNRRGK